MTRVRFAPSPTGKPHLGNAYVAVLNWLFARAQGGTFLLRLDDTDAERSRAALAGQIKVDLAWIGSTMPSSLSGLVATPPPGKR